MATHFDRSAVQEFFEQRVGCPSPEEFGDFVTPLADVRLTLDDAELLVQRVQEDVQGHFEKAALTLVQAIADLELGNRMWAAVKLYYSVFYALRVELHFNGLSVVRCGNSVFTCDQKHGSTLTRYNNRERGDHPISISLTSKHLSGIDILLDAKLDGKTTYLWMKTLREIVQYKMRSAPETVGYDPFFPANQMSISDQIQLFLNDTDPYYCFDPDYAALAIPIKRFQLTAKNVRREKIPLTKEFKANLEVIYEKCATTKLLKPYFW
jgi:hypothetical protein